MKLERFTLTIPVSSFQRLVSWGFVIKHQLTEYVDSSKSFVEREGFVFPLCALKEAKEPKPDRREDSVIADLRPIPFQAESHVDGQDDHGDEV